MNFRDFLKGATKKEEDWTKVGKEMIKDAIKGLDNAEKGVLDQYPDNPEKYFNMYVDSAKKAVSKSVKDGKIPESLLKQINYEIDFAAKNIKKRNGW